jgi:enoyl-CoA hydratase
VPSETKTVSADTDTLLLLVEMPFDGCAVVTLNRPRAMNALSRALRRDITRTFMQLAADGKTRVVVLTGAGRAFCAGVDLKELGAAMASNDTTGPDDGDVPDETPVQSVARFAGPVVGAVNGVAITGGLELAISCDVLIASEAARFADTHARVGLMPAWGMSQRLPRLIGPMRAKEMSLTGNFVDAQQALAWGLVNRVVPAGNLLPDALQMARDMLSSVPDMLPRHKRLIDDGMQLTLHDGLLLEQRIADAERATRDPADIAGRREALQARSRAQIASGAA